MAKAGRAGSGKGDVSGFCGDGEEDGAAGFHGGGEGDGGDGFSGPWIDPRGLIDDGAAVGEAGCGGLPCDAGGGGEDGFLSGGEERAVDAFAGR